MTDAEILVEGGVHPDEIADCQRIVDVFARRGRAITLTMAFAAWEEYSESTSAGWMDLASDDYIFDNASQTKTLSPPPASN